MTYLFIGEDSLSKDAQFKKIKEHFLTKETEQFNLDILFGRGLTLKGFQERLLSLPVGCPKRVIMVKEAASLDEEVREFLLNYVKAPYKQIVLVLDLGSFLRQASFVNRLQRHAKIFRFSERRHPVSFDLSKFIETKKPDLALKVLNQLLKAGERPERILGGLRYSWERQPGTPFDMAKRIKLLLNCDIEIKTGRLKPHYALEKLIINLCAFSQPLRQL